MIGKVKMFECMEQSAVWDAAWIVMKEHPTNKGAMLELFNRENEALDEQDIQMAMFWAKAQQFLSPYFSELMH
ncbi:MAG: hypothetical protein COB14_07585 [Alphaproteobacteria bacterium]|nr:MAG: hypothetical protein COB14_07585 [Alphaproteobacteria bacterium]